jgi:4-carboxymuconolactone decarboxylase
MDDDDRRRIGDQVRREVLGDAHVDRAAATAPAESRDFQDFITRVAWGDVWSRPGHWEELAMHVRAGIRNGLTRDDIAEVLIHTSVYAGVPVANHALSVAWRALDEQPEP